MIMRAYFSKNFKLIKQEPDLYLLMVIPILMMLVFFIIPSFWLIISFQDYNIFKGIQGSQWVGVKHFQQLFGDEEFVRVLSNTIIISLYRFVFLFPLPIIIALVLNEVRHSLFKKGIQTVLYLPHFLSWVVAGAMVLNILSYNGGIVNELLRNFGLSPYNFLGDKHLFRGILVISGGWKEAGWNTIIYLAAMTSIDPCLYEASELDGAGRFRKMWSITLAGISGTIVTLMLLRIGGMLQSNLDQVLMLYNPAVYETGDVIDTFVYRQGLSKMEYSYSTAVGLFNSVVGFVLIIFSNGISKKVSDRSIW